MRPTTRPPLSASSPLVRIALGLVFAVLALISISLLSGSAQIRNEIRNISYPARNLTAGVETSAARSVSFIVAYQATGDRTQQRRFSHERLATIRALEELGKLTDQTMNPDLRRQHLLLVRAVDNWFEEVVKRKLLTERMDRTEVLTKLYEAQKAIEEIDQASADLGEGFGSEVDHQRERIDHLEWANVGALTAIAGLSLLSALIAYLAARRLDSQGRQLETALRVRNETLRIVSHDLGNPTSNIVLACQLLSSGQVSPAQLDSSVGIIQRAVNRMRSLTQDLLDVARLESGKNLELKRTTFNIDDVVAEACDASRALADKKQLRLTWKSETWTIHADRHRVSQALANLIDNAIKFTPEGGEVSVVCRREEHEIMIRVTDTGSGIASSDYDTIFEPFRRREPDVEGTGLGLAIVKGIVEQHGGRVWVGGNPAGRGTTFSLTLPLTS